VEEEVEAGGFHCLLQDVVDLVAAARLKNSGVANIIKGKEIKSSIFNKRSQRNMNNFLFDMVLFLLGWEWGVFKKLCGWKLKKTLPAASWEDLNRMELKRTPWF
jgi:hypothetical protein